MNFQEIINELKNADISVRDFGYEDYDAPKSLGEVEEVAQHGGEGEGDDWYSVKHFKDHNVYVKVSGYYSSGNGTDFEEWEDAVKEVTPQTKTVVVYE